MTTDILGLIEEAAKQGRDPTRLQAEMVERARALWDRLPSKPFVMKRLQRKLEGEGSLDAMDADVAIVAMGRVIGSASQALQDELTKLILVVARMGGTVSSLRLGYYVAAALQTCPDRQA